MVFVAVGIIGCYLLLLFFPMVVWRQMEFSPLKISKEKISVIVPFRNEALNLQLLVQSLRAQTHTNFEVIFVNDHSNDSSLTVLTKLLSNDESFHFKIISLSETKGKKAALTAGVRESLGQIIVTTDADCWFGQNWLQSMTSLFANPKVKMVTGPVVFEGASFFQKLQRIEFGAVMASSAALIGLGKPTMANGANLAYRKSIFMEVAGFLGIEQTPSGDDELLMMKVVAKYPNGIVFAKNPAGVVQTSAHNNMADFIQQRKRWASKWKVGMRWSTMLSALFVYVVQLSFVGVVIFSIMGQLSFLLVLALWLIKIVLELLLIRNYFSDLEQPFSLFHFFCTQTFYPFYVLYIGLTSNFGRFQWKDRSFKS